MSEALSVLVGTKAQYIKTAPILLELDRRGIGYQLVYTGQHSETFDLLEAAFGTRAPDDVFVPNFEASTHGGFMRWVFSFLWSAVKRIARGDFRSVRLGVVHGDTASTLLTAAVLRVAGVDVAHVEAGLRSPRLLEPFPEEIVRRLVSRMATLHLVPDQVAADNLRARRGRVINTQGNTLRDALAGVLSASTDAHTKGGEGGYGIVSLHRSENLSRKADFDLLLEEVLRAADVGPLNFVLHPATRERIKATGWSKRLEAHPDLTLLPRMGYPDFVRLLIRSNFLMTDGGSNQEEAAMLGLPTLLLRRATERQDGLQANVAVSGLQREAIRAFVERYTGRHWSVKTVNGASPSSSVVDALEDFLGTGLSHRH